MSQWQPGRLLIAVQEGENGEQESGQKGNKGAVTLAYRMGKWRAEFGQLCTRGAATELAEPDR